MRPYTSPTPRGRRRLLTASAELCSMCFTYSSWYAHDDAFEPNTGHTSGQQKSPPAHRAGGPLMVGVARIELATPAMSTQCSTTELHAHFAAAAPGEGWPLPKAFPARKHLLRQIKNFRRPVPVRTCDPPRARDRAGGTAWTEPAPAAWICPP